MSNLRRYVPRPSTILATLALVAALAGSATAASVITGKQIADNSITSADVKRGSLRASDLAPSARRSLRGASGPAGEAGAAGPPGAAGVSRVLTAATGGVAIDSGDGDEAVLDLVVPSGRYAVDATLAVSSQGAGDVCKLRGPDAQVLDELQFTANGSNGKQIVLQGEFDSSARSVGRFRVSCQADDQLQVADARIRAFEVGQIG